MKVFVSYFTVDDRVIARWTNNLYYAGKVGAIENELVNVLFDDGDKITHSIRDSSAVILDKEPNEVQIGQHVLATWKGGQKYYIGYVSHKDSNNRLKVTFDDNDEDFYLAEQLRIFPDQYSVHEGWLVGWEREIGPLKFNICHLVLQTSTSHEDMLCIFALEMNFLSGTEGEGLPLLLKPPRRRPVNLIKFCLRKH